MLFDVLKASNSQVVQAVLSENQLDDECMISLGEFLKCSNHLKELKIDVNRITDKGIELLSSFLTGNSSLKFLGLTHNPGITDKSIPFLNKMIESSRLEIIEI